MPVRFTRLRIAGFKSFAEPATIEIRPGLTGIVGPNGCGKSNVVEALRWAMGESSARSLRGGDMEDVIFAGTAGRPSRNIAEVGLTLDETAGVATPPFHEQPELEIVRRIERGSGSAFRVNGRDARARDVQTLLADLASGARASAMVSQGRVGALVSSRPEELRAVLEEAAGITGLHARRHEAELKLRAAETNLSRAEDARGQLDTQLAGLKRQARQASRYRNISGAIRTAEAELLAIQRAVAEAGRVAAQASLAAAREAAADGTDAANVATQQAGEAAGALPPLRLAEADARTALERHRIAQEQLAAEEQRAVAALAEAERGLAQVHEDLDHAEQLRRDAASAEVRLEAESVAVAELAAAYPARMEAAVAATEEAADTVRQAEAESNRATEVAAEASARAQAVAQELSAATQRLRRLDEVHARVGRERVQVQGRLIDPARIAVATAEQEKAAAAAADAAVTLERCEGVRLAAQAALADSRARQTAVETVRARLAAEARALAEVLAVKDGEQWPPMVDRLDVPAGLEAALGAVLGEELTSAADPSAPRHWRELPELEWARPLPAGATALESLVRGPAALRRALSHIGLVPDEATGEAAQPSLMPGQVLVSRDGAVWRWDGYTIRAGTPTPAAVRLQQRNRLTVLRGELDAAEGSARVAEEALAEATAAEREAGAAEQNALAERRRTGQRHEEARAAAAHLAAQAAAAAAALDAVEQQLARILSDHAEAVAAFSRAEAAQAELPDVAALRAGVDQARAVLSAARARETAARSERESLEREQEARIARLRAIEAERGGWRERAAGAETRIADLGARREAAEGERDRLASVPGQVAARRAEALEALRQAHAAHRETGERLASAEALSAAADRAARAADAALAQAREDAVRAEGVSAQAEHAWGVIAERVLERLGAGATLPEPAGSTGPEAEDKARRRHERLLKERDEMGPVNLRADVEASEVEKRIADIERERDEIGTAIAKLRGSIGHLNREGRERLTSVFEQVDRNFQALFSRMFGGGRAHLALVGSDDPLAAGLEIYAQPPGKKLATLSLLSGGEQALTALSLIFAVFRCNPAPVCVLDEVDAPLDDANVDRFCTLLEDMTRETETRFLVVTHHPLTMARMDRLYGVTMQERGVSRLLSVDLAAATEMAEPQRMAAE